MKDDIYDRLNRAKSKITGLERLIENTRIEIAELESIREKDSKKLLIEKITQLSNSVTNDEQSAIREKIHNEIRNVVAGIVIYNLRIDINPFDYDDLISSKLRNDLETQGIETKHQFKSLFESDTGKSLFHKSERKFTVHFHSGTARTVEPYHDYSYMSISKHNAKFLSRNK